MQRLQGCKEIDLMPCASTGVTVGSWEMRRADPMIIDSLHTRFGLVWTSTFLAGSANIGILVAYLTPATIS